MITRSRLAFLAWLRLEESFTAISVLPNPHQDFLSFAKYPPNDTDLFTLFNVVVLLDTDRVNKELARNLLVAKVTEKVEEILADNDRLAVDLYGGRGYVSAPGVGGCVIDGVSFRSTSESLRLRGEVGVSSLSKRVSTNLVEVGVESALYTAEPILQNHPPLPGVQRLGSERKVVRLAPVIFKMPTRGVFEWTRRPITPDPHYTGHVEIARTL